MRINNFIHTPEQVNYRSKLDIIGAIYHDWHPQELSNNKIVELKLLHWAPAWFINQIRQSPDCLPSAPTYQLTRNDITYDVIFHNCKLSDINHANKVLLSFRICNELKLNIVLVKFAKYS